MANSLVSFLEQRAGDSLRAVAKYQNENVNLLYYREDLQQNTMLNRTKTIHDNITWDWNPEEDEVTSELGEKQATVQIREESVIIHLLEEENLGYIIGLEPDAARSLTTFVGACVDQIQ